MLENKPLFGEQDFLVNVLEAAISETREMIDSTTKRAEKAMKEIEELNKRLEGQQKALAIARKGETEDKPGKKKSS